jgi:hypothetical protein
MSAQQPTGLGEPDPIGKKSLFQPPGASKVPADKPERPKASPTNSRIRMTLEITKKSLSIMQEMQSKYRLETGHLLPKWRIISESLELYEKARKGKGE